MKTKKGEVALTLTIISLGIMVAGTLFGGIAVKNSQTTTSKADTTCNYYANAVVQKRMPNGKLELLSYKDNNYAPLSTKNDWEHELQLFRSPINTDSKASNDYDAKGKFKPAPYELGGHASVRLTGLDVNKWKVVNTYCSRLRDAQGIEGKGCGDRATGDDTYPSDNNLKINNFLISCGVNISYGWIVEPVLTVTEPLPPITLPARASTPTPTRTPLPTFTHTPTPTTIPPVITSTPSLTPTPTSSPPTQPPTEVPTTEPTISAPPDSSHQLKVLLLIVNPYLDDVKKNTIEYYGYSDPRKMAQDTAALIKKNKNINIQPEIVKTIETNEVPPLLVGDPSTASLRQCLDNLGNSACTCEKGTSKKQPSCSSSCNGGLAGRFCNMDTPKGPFGEDKTCSTCNLVGEIHIDYVKLFRNINNTNICTMVNNDEVDEVWIATYPYSGFGENDMIGPNPFFINGDVVINTACKKNVATLSIDYSLYNPQQQPEDDTAAVLAMHSLLHRVEATMMHVYGSWEYPPEHNWDTFVVSEHDGTHESGCGAVHFTPNSTSEFVYNLDNTSESYCDNFIQQYPNIDELDLKETNCSAWGCNEIGFYQWWADHIPNKPGVATDGKLNNWWTYVYNTEFARRDSEVEKFHLLDFNKDNKINGIDYAALIRRIQNPRLIKEGDSLGDFNGDKVINSLDVSKEIQFLGKTISTPKAHDHVGNKTH